MTIKFKLAVSDGLTAEGYPLVVKFSHQQKRKQEIIGYSHENHFIEAEQIVSVKHPDYDILAPMMMDIKNKARKIIMQRIFDVEKAHSELFAVDFSQIGFMDFAEKLISDMKAMAENLGKANDLKSKNKVLGNVKVYENVIAQFGNFAKNVSLQNLDYEVLLRFRNYQTGIGNSKSTVHLYLRTLRAIYNKGISVHKLADEKPFTGIFTGLKQRSFDNKKKYLDKPLLAILENLDLKSEKQKYLDLFLLQFYFAGCDLIDLYYLRKKQLRRGRIVFERTKTNTGARIDLKVHPKAAQLIKKYDSDPEWMFPWKKEKDSYESFRRTYQRALIYIQEKHSIEILPDGGNMGVKVARHTFATIAKNLMIEPDVIRELMGHERDEVDNYYKDKYPEAIRDKALFDIIE